MLMYRLVYHGIEGAHILHTKDFADYASSPERIWDTLDAARQQADWLHAAVVSGFYTVIGQAGAVVNDILKSFLYSEGF